MKMAMICYNEAMEEEVMEVLEHCGLKYYSKIEKTFGKGKTSGTHLGNDIWPGINNILLTASGDSEIKQLISCVRELRKTLGKEGIKAFVWGLEEMT